MWMKVRFFPTGHHTQPHRAPPVRVRLFVAVRGGEPFVPFLLRFYFYFSARRMDRRERKTSIAERSHDTKKRTCIGLPTDVSRLYHFAKN
jgi:hypothetical protein